jgi:hypothetical protein
LSVRQTEAAVRGRATPRRSPRPATPLPPVADVAIDRFYGAFEAPVTVRPGRGGRLVVQLEFADEDALRRALDRLPGDS